MTKIKKYKINDNGGYDVLVENVRLSSEIILMLDNDFPVEADVTVVDGRRISIKQRKKIFALLNDIYAYTGQPIESLREMFQFYLETIKGYESISLSNTTVTKARELIEIIIEWTFLHDVPLNYKTTDLLKEDSKFIYLTVINRQCAICGKPNSDLAHKQAIGRGRNRNQMDHYGHEVLALCREHHSMQHDMGVDSFDKHYHLTNSWIKVDDRLNKMLQGK